MSDKPFAVLKGRPDIPNPTACTNMANNNMSFDPNMLSMAMALANTMMQFSGNASPMPTGNTQAGHQPPQDTTHPKGKKGRKLSNDNAGGLEENMSLVVHGAAAPAESPAEMYSLGRVCKSTVSTTHVIYAMNLTNLMLRDTTTSKNGHPNRRRDTTQSERTGWS